MKIKKIFNKIKRTIDKNRSLALIAIVSVLALIFGTLTLGFLKTVLIVTVIDMCLFIPKLIEIIKKKKRPKKVKSVKNSKKEKKKKRKIWKIILIIFSVLFILGCLAITWFFYIVIKDSPKFNPRNLYQKESSILYTNKGNIFAKLGEQKREIVSYDEMSEVLIDAIIATEDSRFFQHNGFDLPRFIKASIGQFLGKDAGGASTLTMQVSKNAFTGNEAKGFEGIKRKFNDIYMAIFQIEKKYTKQEIFEFYANSYNMGAGAWGVEQASLTYFGKNAKDLNLAEASMIAGLFQAPNAYNPYVNPELTTKRRSTVLYLMQRHGYITKEERLAAEAISVESLLIKTDSSSNKYRAYIDTVAAEIESKLKINIYVTPVEVYTNLDVEKQDHITNLVDGGAFAWENDVVNAGIAVVDSKTGALVAVGAGRNRTKIGQFNYATQLNSQIGSTSKPLYDYGPAIEYGGASTYTPLVDEEYKYSSGVSMSNWDGKFEGLMTSRYALIKSRNIPALKTFQSVSNKNIKEFVTKLGLSPELGGGIIHEAHSIGGYNGENPVSMAAAYAAFGNGGYYTKPYTINKVVNRESGEEYIEKPKKERVMSEETAYMIADMLVDTTKDALGRYSNVNGVSYGAKTGTTNFSEADFKKFNLPYGAINDLWVASTSTDYSIAIWYGYEKINRDFVTKFGNTQHSKLFQEVAKGVFKDKTGFKKPNGVVEVEVEKESFPNALLPSAHTPADMRVKELFKKGTEPTQVSQRYSALDNVTNLNSKIDGSKVNLTWNPIKNPDAIDQTYLTNYYKTMYKKAEDQSKYLGVRQSYNNSNIGTLTYNIYLKNSDGSLKFLGTSKEPNFTYNLTTSTGNLTFIVKSSYTIFKNNASSGSELKVNITGVPSIITSQLNGKSSIDVSLNGTYTEPSPSVIVLEELVDVTNKATVTISITRKSDNKTFTNVDKANISSIISTAKEDIYTITYRIVYGTFNDTLTRTVNIKTS